MPMTDAGIARWNSRTLLAAIVKSAMQPLVFAGAALLLIIWASAFLKMHADHEHAKQQSLADARNYALVFEQDVLRTTFELDRIIKYIRQTYERLGHDADWSTLVRDEHTINNRTAQIAIIDETGGMITSSAMLRPTGRIDLSDREHFKVHVNASEDSLFISRPVLGRASKKWSVQFTRGFRKLDGSFGGVIVVSLDPSALTATYDQLSSFQRGSFLLKGHDGIIRAGAGADRDLVGGTFTMPEGAKAEVRTADGTSIFRELRNGDAWMAATRQVGQHPLDVVVSAPATHLAEVHKDVRLYFGAATIVSVGVVFGIMLGLRRQSARYDQIKKIAQTDILTGLHNRHSFQVILADLMRAAPSERNCALHLIDLDRFKAVNDTHGHKVGDMLLQASADRLKAAVRKSDLVFRLGGDEFALLQTDCTTYDQAGVVAKRLCRLIAEPFCIEGQTLLIGASIGVVAGEDVGVSKGALLQSADMALYLAKAEGRGTYRSFNKGMNESLARRRKLEVELQEAAERGELEVHYQPKVTLATGLHVTGFEALVRWRHPVHGMLPPLEFIQLAEETGAITRVGAWVLGQACRDIMALTADATVAVNCSAAQFARDDVHQLIANTLRETGIPPHRLEIEITETMLMKNDQRTLSQLEKIRSLGVHISLDDFGTGFSSLSYLHTYPVDCIKIDRSFVKTIGTDKDAGPIIRAIVAMASELKMSTVAEGVETREQLDAVRNYGCSAVQGYLFSPPKRANDVLPMAGTIGLIARAA